MLCGNASEVEDVGRGSRKSYLFFLTSRNHGIGLTGDVVIGFR